jgi:hypothetical protein
MAGLDDFTIPATPSLQAERIDYSGLLRATEQNQKNSSDLIKSGAEILSKAGQYLHKVAQDAAFVNMQADLLHAKEGANAKAIDLVQQGPGKGFDFITSEGIDDNGQPAPMRTIKLNPDFQTYLDGAQQALADKYKAFPDVVKYALESFTGTAVEAHKAAYAEATKDAVDNGKAGVDRALAYAEKEYERTGDPSLLDAFASNPTYQNFYHPEVLAEKVAQQRAAGELGLLSKDLLQSVETEGKDAAKARLAMQQGIAEKDRNELNGQIDTVDAGIQSQWTQKVIDGAVKAHDEGGMIYSQALDQLVSQVPGFRQEAMMKAATSYLDAKDKINNTAMRNSVNKFNQDGNSWEDTLRWFSDRDQKFQSNTEYQQEYAYIEARIKDEKEPPKGPLANRIPPYLLLLDSEPSSEKLDKGSVFRQAFKAGGYTVPDGPDKGKVIKIDGEELDYLLKNRRDDDPTLHDAKSMINSWSSPNPVTGAPGLVPREQGVAATMMLDQWYRDKAKAGKTPTLEDIYSAVDHIKAVTTDKVLNKEVGKLFSSEGILNQIFMGGPSPADKAASIKDMQGRIQRGELSEMAQTEGFQPTLRRFSAVLQDDLTKNLGVKVTKAEQHDTSGQQYFHSAGGNVYAYALDANGTGRWHAVKAAQFKAGSDVSKWPVVSK